MSVLLLPLGIIHVDPKLNVSRGGKQISAGSVSSLAEDILSNGQLEPVGVVSLDGAEWLSEAERNGLSEVGKEFVLVFGFRRFCALKEIERSRSEPSSIKAIDQGSMSLASAELANVAENWSRDPPNEFDLTMACDRFVRFHKLSEKEIALRINRSPAFVHACIQIAGVAPEVLDHYRVNCSREMRRRMVELSAIEAMTTRERHELQRRAWEEQESQAASHRRTDPQGGMRGKPPKRSGAIASRTELKLAAERLITAREVFDGAEWRPLDNEVRSVLREMLRWSLDASSEPPVR